MTERTDGFWQVVYDEPDEIIAYPALYTTMSLRRFGCAIYVDGHFIQIRTEAGRRPPVGWPGSADEAVSYFRTSIAFGGRATRHGSDIHHELTMAGDPRTEGSTLTWSMTIDGDRASVEASMPDGSKSHETWRRLSGAGTQPLAGAWECQTATDRWLWLVAAGHYGIIREDNERASVPEGNLTDDQILVLARGYGANAGAQISTAQSFDNWPMVGANAAGFEARKHETFRIVSAVDNLLVLSLFPDGSAATEWHRIAPTKPQVD